MQSSLEISRVSTYLLGISLIGFFLLKWLANRTLPAPYPPGPKGRPILGNVLDVPIDKSWLKYDEWQREYGDIISLNMLGKRFVILGSTKRATDLFETRASTYSSRPRLVMLAEMMRWDIVMAFLPYGTLWHRHRKMFHDHFHPNVVERYIPSQTRETRALLLRLLESPENFVTHVRHNFAATIMDISYGIKIKPENDVYVKTFEEAIKGMSIAGVPGSFLVDLIPGLKYIPSWMPGTGFKEFARHYGELTMKMGDLPWNFVKETIREGTAVPSLTTSLIDSLPDESDPQYQEQVQISKGVASITFAGGCETISSAVTTFFLAMVLYPEVQQRAQKEIDTIVGQTRLPDYSDKNSLEYISAIVMETLRWQPATPLGAAHTVTEDDIYDGYFIPKDTIVMGNAWSILHDPEAYPEPEKFKPERFLRDGKRDPNVRNPNVAAFGFGRRICPGRFLAENSLFLLVAAVLAVFDIKPACDANGNPIDVKPEMSTGIASKPLPFKCSITPRSSVAEMLVREAQRTIND